MADGDRTADGVGARGGGTPDHPKRVFLAIPDDYYDLTDEQQNEVCGVLADVFIRQLGLGDDVDEDTADPNGTREALVDTSAQDLGSDETD